ncbi:hypothetical protein BH18ACT7_BH18ACT7_24700 [soil metagenome]
MGKARARPRLRGDRGSAAVEHLIVYPLLLLLIFAVVQSVVWWHARNMALAAAESGAREGRVTSSAQAGSDTTQSYLDRIANDTFAEVLVSSAGSGPGEVQITVTGTVPSLFPGLWDLDVSQSAAGPIEAPR